MTPTDQPHGGHHYTDEEMHNEEVAHEHGEVDIRTVLGFGVAILAVVAFSAALTYGLFWSFERQAKARDPQLAPRAITGGEPQGPPLLFNESANLRKFRQEEEGKLESYGWMSQGQGIAHVPIDVAKRLVVQHGLPVRAGATDDPALGTHAPAYGESSGGRTIPVKHAAPPAAPQTEPAQQPAPAQHQGPAAQEIKK
jgi:hypothetical protein